MKNKKNLMSIISLITVIIALILFVFWPDNSDTAILGLSIIILISVGAVVCGFIGKSQIKKTNEKGKGLALTAIILGFIIIIWSAYSIFIYNAIKDINFNDSTICPKVSDCVDNGDGTSACTFQKVSDVPCSTENLTSEQFKK